MTKEERNETIEAIIKLGELFRRPSPGPDLTSAMEQAEKSNPWFTQENILYAVRQWGETLTEENITRWLEKYPLPDRRRNVLLVLAGNIPMVGLHDILCVYLSGHRAVIKPSGEDTALIRFVTEFLQRAAPGQADQLCMTKRATFEGIDAVIATGSDNTARYFEYYFRDIPTLIRHSRYSIGIIDAQTTDEELALLGDDILRYFGMGCRSVSKIFVPEGFDMKRLCRALEKQATVSLHNKYKNNYDYRRALYSLGEQAGIYDTGFLLLVPQSGLSAPLGVAGYEYYGNTDQIRSYLAANQEHIQCVAGKGYVPFGRTQSPSLSDYADGADTMEFLAF